MTRSPHSVEWENIKARVTCSEPGCLFLAFVEDKDEETVELEVYALAEAHQRIHRRKPKVAKKST